MAKCKECGNEFEQKSKKMIFCSSRCKQKDYRKGVNDLLAEARKSRIVPVKIKKAEGQTKAEIKIELPETNILSAKTKFQEMLEQQRQKLKK